MIFKTIQQFRKVDLFLLTTQTIICRTNMLGPGVVCYR